MKLGIKKGDHVKIIAGNHKGKTGIVATVMPKQNTAIIQGVNFVVKHVKPTTQNSQGKIQKKEAPIHISNLMYIDQASGLSTRIGRKRDEHGKLQRYAKKTGQIII